MDRRELFKILGATLIMAREGAAEHEHGTSVVVDIENYKPRLLSIQQYRTIDALAETIIPADAQSPGAHAAGVAFYIDSVLYYADAETQQRWHKGLGEADESARAQFGKAFAECSVDEKDQLIAMMARNEKAPSTELAHFFHFLKQTSVEAYALSEVGMTHYFGYKGNTAIKAFPACTHPEH